MNYNSFKLAGRYIHKYKDNDNHYIILIALMYPINKKEPTFIEIDIYDKELITYIDNLNENDLVGIFGHIWHPAWIVIPCTAIVCGIISISINTYTNLHQQTEEKKNPDSTDKK